MIGVDHYWDPAEMLDNLSFKLEKAVKLLVEWGPLALSLAQRCRPVHKNS